MIIVLSYYEDGSSAPGLKFFPTNRELTGLVATHLVKCMDLGMSVEVYELTSINEDPKQLVSQKWSSITEET